MDVSFFFLVIVLSIPLIPIFIEIFRRREKRETKEFHEQTSGKEKSNISKEIPVLESPSVMAHMRITDGIVRVVGNLSVPEGQEMKESMVIHGNLTLGSKCHVYGSLSVFGKVEIGEGSTVEGHILAEKKITIGRSVKVTGIVDSADDIILDENATVEAVSTEKSVTLSSGAKINRKVLAGESLLTKTSLVKRAETELPMKEEKGVEVPQPTVSPFATLLEEKEIEKTINEKDRLFKSLQERIERFDSHKKRQTEELSVDEVFERLLESKIRLEIKEKMGGKGSGRT